MVLWRRLFQLLKIEAPSTVTWKADSLKHHNGKISGGKIITFKRNTDWSTERIVTTFESGRCSTTLTKTDKDGNTTTTPICDRSDQLGYYRPPPLFYIDLTNMELCSPTEEIDKLFENGGSCRTVTKTDKDEKTTTTTTCDRSDKLAVRQLPSDTTKMGLWRRLFQLLKIGPPSKVMWESGTLEEHNGKFSVGKLTTFKQNPDWSTERIDTTFENGSCSVTLTKTNKDGNTTTTTTCDMSNQMGYYRPPPLFYINLTNMELCFPTEEIDKLFENERSSATVTKTDKGEKTTTTTTCDKSDK